MALNGDAPFAFQIHIIEHLCLHLLLAYGIGIFKQTVCKGAFAMINMGNDAKITNTGQRFHQR